MIVRTRFAPSPTGSLHVGGARTALFCYLYARRHQGVNLLRIEDTDAERSTKAAVDTIIEGLEWLGIAYDQTPFYQSQRMALYRLYIERLLNSGDAYRCDCSRERLQAMREEQHACGMKPRYDGHCRDREVSAANPAVVRFRNPRHGEVIVNDLVWGRLTFSNQELDDLIIARPDGSPTYNFTVVVDDLEMAITHVIRGDDHINNTPRQMNILRALDAEAPVYAHVPMILGANGKRLSKRHGAVGVMEFRDQGYLPEALRNYLVRLGWSHHDQEIFSLEELFACFSIEAVNRSPATFDFDKLKWLNQHYIKTADGARLAAILARRLRAAGLDPSTGPAPDAIVEVQRERSKTMLDMAAQSAFAYCDRIAFDAAAARKYLRPAAQPLLQQLRLRLQQLGPWEPTDLYAAVSQVVADDAVKLRSLAQPLRVALTGTAASPSIEHTLWMTGRERALRRIDAAIAYIQQHSVPRNADDQACIDRRSTG